LIKLDAAGVPEEHPAQSKLKNNAAAIKSRKIFHPTLTSFKFESSLHLGNPMDRVYPYSVKIAPDYEIVSETWYPTEVNQSDFSWVRQNAKERVQEFKETQLR
jgi:hypothetical protein